MMARQEARRHRAGQREHPQERPCADRRTARLAAREHDRRDREALGHLVQEHRDEEKHAERRPDHETGGDGDAVEERVDAQAEERQIAGRRAQERLGMDFLTEVEVRRHRVLEQVHAEVTDQDDQERVRHLHALRQHPDEGGREHEPRPARDEITQRRQAFLMRRGDEQSAREIRGRRDGREGQVC
jgi:hypothetical protein